MVSIFARKAVQKDVRRSVRVSEHIPITWHIQEESVTGTAKVRNLSDAGMMIETHMNIPSRDNCVLSIEPSLQNHVNFLPATGRIVWSKKNGFNPLNPRSFLWGVEFSDANQETVTLLREKVQSSITRAKNAEKTLNITGATLIVIMLTLAGYVLFQQSILEQSYEQTSRSLLQASNQQADLYTQVSTDLKQTKTTLAETQTLLAQVKEQNIALQNELQVTNSKLQTLTEENNKLTKEVNDLTERLKPFEGEVSAIDQGKSYIAKVRQRLRNIKIGIRDVKQKAHQARIAAQKERDQILLAQGNKGYFTKDSKPVTPNNTAQAPQQQNGKKIKIDVSIVE